MVRNVWPWLQSATPIPALLIPIWKCIFTKDNLPAGRLFLPSPPLLTGTRLRPGIWMRVQPQPSRYDGDGARSIGAQRKSHSFPQRGTQASFLKEGCLVVTLQSLGTGLPDMAILGCRMLLGKREAADYWWIRPKEDLTRRFQAWEPWIGNETTGTWCLLWLQCKADHASTAKKHKNLECWWNAQTHLTSK